MQTIRCIIDIGNGYIKGAVFGEEEGKTIVLAKDMVKTKGMRKGKILDTQDFALRINELLQAFAKKLGGDFIEEVVVGVSHPDMKISRVAESKRVLSNQIETDDIIHLEDVVTEATYIANHEVIKIIPVVYIIDDETKAKDPEGMEARKLELIADVFMIPKVFYTQLMDVFQKLDLHITDIVPNILGVAEVALDFDLKDLGVVVIDIGANQTSYVVYEEGYPLFYGIIPVGGEEVTKDISIGLQIDIAQAEAIKREKGVILLGGEKPLADESIDTKFLSDIMVARYEELFEIVQQKLVAHNKDGRLPGGVFLTGGGAKAANVDQLAKDVFTLAGFLAHDRQVGVGDLSHNQQFISVIGNFAWTEKHQYGKKRGFSFGSLGGSLGGGLTGTRQAVKGFFEKLF